MNVIYVVFVVVVSTFCDYVYDAAGILVRPEVLTFLLPPPQLQKVLHHFSGLTYFKTCYIRRTKQVLPASLVSAVVTGPASLFPSLFRAYTRKSYLDAGRSPVQSKPRYWPETTLLSLSIHPCVLSLHSTVYSMISALPLNPGLHVKKIERAVTPLARSTSGVEGGDGRSEKSKSKSLQI